MGIQELAGEGILGTRPGLMVTEGLQIPGVTVLGKHRVAPDTYLVRHRSALIGPAAMRTYTEGRVRSSYAQSGVLAARDGQVLRLEVRDDPASPSQWPPLEFADVVELQWEHVDGAAWYRIYQGAVLVASIPDRSDRHYFVYETPPLIDGTAYDYHVYAESDAGVQSPTADASFTMITYPAKEELTLTYDEGLGGVIVDAA